VSTCESRKVILSTFEAQEVHTASCKLKNTHCVFTEVLAFLRWSVLRFCLA